MAKSVDLYQILDQLRAGDFKRFSSYLSQNLLEGYKPIPRGQLEHSDVTNVVDKMKQFYPGNGPVIISLHILEKMNHNELADEIKRKMEIQTPDQQRAFPAASSTEAEDAVLQKVKKQYQAKMKNGFGKIQECVEEGKAETLLSKIYTELFITEGESEGVNRQHEHCITEAISKRTDKRKINCNDIFEEHKRTVMTTGIAGIGKSVCVQKFILDWAEGWANQDVHFIFALPLRQLNLMQNDSCSLKQLLLHFHPELKDVITPIMAGTLKIIVIFDGLDESKFLLNVEQSKDMSDHLGTVPLHLMIANIIKGKLLPKAHVWITSRPAAVKQIPSKYIHKWTELEGFTDQQKDEYFKKKVTDPSEAAKVITFIKKSKSLYIMCHIPVFCWILATVLLDSTSAFPETLTEMYIHFLFIEMKRKNQKYIKEYEPDDTKLLESNKEAILKLSKLAYIELLKGNSLFDETSLKECDIDVNDQSLYSGICSEFFKSEHVLRKRKVFCFVHLSIQEFLAAFFLFYSFVNKDTEALKLFASQTADEDTAMKGPRSKKRKKSYSQFGHDQIPMTDFFWTAVDKSKQNKDGRLDLFVRFLLGISLESNQKLLQGLLTHTESSSESIKKTAQYIKGILSEDIKSPERCMNLLLCLLEIKDTSLHQEIQQYLKSGMKLSPAQCSVLAYMHLMSYNSLPSERTWNVFDVTKYKTNNEGRKRLLVVLRACEEARLVGCGLREDCCVELGSILQSEHLQLKTLDLSSNELGDSVVELLSNGLKHTNCRMETLRLAGCGLSGNSCRIISSVLQAENSQLRELDLSCNHLKDSGVALLCPGLKQRNCRLDTLRLAHCKLTCSSCQTLASVLQSDKSHLKKLDLTNNDLTDTGAEKLCSALGHLSCKLEVLRLTGCVISQRGCEYIVTALRRNPDSKLTELDLSYNHPGYAGLQKLIKLPRDQVKFIAECSSEAMLNKGMKKYACEITLDPNTANKYLLLSEGGRKVTCVYVEHPYPDMPQRFDDCPQILSREPLIGRCYWECEWGGVGAGIGVAYKTIDRNGDGSGFGSTNKSWSLMFVGDRYSALHDDITVDLPASTPVSKRVGVYLDQETGTLSFYSVSSDTLTHLYTFYTTFTDEPLYTGFMVWSEGDSVSLG